MLKFTTTLLLLGASTLLPAQKRQYWQQRVAYDMSINFDVKTHQFKGKQKLTYFNNSPDTLRQVFYHLYFNAFQPNSMMDVRSQTLPDPDARVRSRIGQLKENEVGYQHVELFKQEGQEVDFEVTETILQATLLNPILPGDSTTFDMTFEGQVPLQIRRSGRASSEGVDYSMTQWFPKIAEYDEMGWHAHPYVGREFYAPWGRYKVDITIDKDYVLGGTGVIQNPEEVGAGYAPNGVEVKSSGKTKTWEFLAENVHDFAWTADTDYVHVKRQMKDGPLLHFLFIPSDKTKNWEQLPDYAEKAFTFIQENYGAYPFPQYSVLQGGDGGMEYPMATLITGERGLRSLVGVTVHEAIHSWYQGLLATNESYYAWMDEGFTTFASGETMAHLFPDEARLEPQTNNYNGYIAGATSSRFQQEPLSTHADHFQTNSAYGWGSYTKGSVIMGQLRYIMGLEPFQKGLKQYFNQWKFKHPKLNDFVRVMEKASGLELHWYFEYMVNGVHTTDYAIEKVTAVDDKTQIQMKRIGAAPMPIDLTIYRTDGSKLTYYAPLIIMHGEKAEANDPNWVIGPDWPWTHPNYTAEIDVPLAEIERVVIDDRGWMADIDRANNIWNK